MPSAHATRGAGGAASFAGPGGPRERPQVGVPGERADALRPGPRGRPQGRPARCGRASTRPPATAPTASLAMMGVAWCIASFTTKPHGSRKVAGRHRGQHQRVGGGVRKGQGGGGEPARRTAPRALTPPARSPPGRAAPRPPGRAFPRPRAPPPSPPCVQQDRGPPSRGRAGPRRGARNPASPAPARARAASRRSGGTGAANTSGRRSGGLDDRPAPPGRGRSGRAGRRWGRRRRGGRCGTAAGRRARARGSADGARSSPRARTGRGDAGADVGRGRATRPARPATTPEAPGRGEPQHAALGRAQQRGTGARRPRRARAVATPPPISAKTTSSRSCSAANAPTRKAGAWLVTNRSGPAGRRRSSQRRPRRPRRSPGRSAPR